jgi:DNA repair exonuclease SbcCD ATPase subunit
MDEGAIERARKRVEERADTAALDSLVEQVRPRLERLTAEAEQAATAIPERIENAIQEGMRDQVAPAARNLAEIRGLMNQLIRRLDHLESDSAVDRHARVDDLALLVDLISSGWANVDRRLGRIESAVIRLQQGLEQRGATVYRIEDRRPEAASGP